MKILITLLGLLLLSLVLAIWGYNSIEPKSIVYQNLSYTPLAIEESDFAYWTHMPLTYNYSNGAKCLPERIRRTEVALKEIENFTDSEVSFVNVEGKADISFVCSNETIVNLGNKEKTLGEAQIEYELETKKIIGAKLFLHEGVPKNCKYPDVEIHEVMHALGHKHNSNDKSIMNEIHLGCLDKIDKSVDGVLFEKLKRVY